MLDLLAVGELNVDLILSGLAHPPQLGTEIVAQGCDECMGSSAAICACAASSLGLNTAIYGKLGLDERGALVRRSLLRYGVDTSAVEQSAAYRTGLTVSVSMPGDRAMITFNGDTIDCFTAAEIPIDTVRARHLHVSSYFLHTRMHEGFAERLLQARRLGMTVSLDAGWDDTGRWRAALGRTLEQTDLFFPNEIEATRIADTRDVVAAARRIAEAGCTAVVKLGEKGALACQPDGAAFYMPAIPCEPVDTTGAGDTFNAGFLTAWLNGQSIPECLAYGNAAASISLSWPGGATRCPTPEEVNDVITRARQSGWSCRTL